ncbi:hypothetical protein BKA82DRAFT_4018320 [Pisolithus tinctorius]|nr:hypothetical protein BKA82DRAFT_4018320 [Pisolithus tinctorius]
MNGIVEVIQISDNSNEKKLCHLLPDKLHPSSPPSREINKVESEIDEVRETDEGKKVGSASLHVATKFPSVFPITSMWPVVAQAIWAPSQLQVIDELHRREWMDDDWMGDAEQSEGVQPKGLLE